MSEPNNQEGIPLQPLNADEDEQMTTPQASRRLVEVINEEVRVFHELLDCLHCEQQAIVDDDIDVRSWTDVIWTISPQARRLEGGQVRLIYYGILSLYGVWGLFALAFFDPLQIAIIGAVLQNVALGCAAMHTLYVNRTLLPREMRPNRLMQVGLVFCSVFFIAISVVVLVTRVF